MKPREESNIRLAITQSKAKMYEFFVPEKDHINIEVDCSELFLLVIGMLGDACELYIKNSNSISDNIELKDNLTFSARFLDSYVNAKLADTLSPILTLLCSATFYLAEFQGSSSVLINKRYLNQIYRDGDNLENLLYWVLKSNEQENLIVNDNLLFANEIRSIKEKWDEYISLGKKKSYDFIIEKISTIQERIYKDGTDMQLLLVDLIWALFVKKYGNSIWYTLPKYSDLSIEVWGNEIRSAGNFIKEIWPSQHLLGKREVFKGQSAVIQMPTSAGKTKAMELLIRSRFLSGKIETVLIVAPFKALCSEIRESFVRAFNNDVDISDISDVFQTDINIEQIISSNKNAILVMTPEKLLYTLRQDTSFLKNIGLLILDEGHQFDNGSRGITYEFLITTLKELLPKEIQIILISAVISNASEIGNWLLNGKGEIIVGSDMYTTYRTVGFISWKNPLGRIEFVNEKNINSIEFFVPRIIEEIKLNSTIKDIVFPSKTEGASVALYLGLKMVPNGSVAIFCGTKKIPLKIACIAYDIFSNGYKGNIPVNYSDKAEVQKLKNLISLSIGEKSIHAKVATLGIFIHHALTPQGIRMSIEHAMRENLVKFVLCTSTLAQGVNLPIKYLLVTSIYQAGQKISIRDFHNLMGRVGRAGMHTEGSVIFTDPKLYDERNSDRKYKWVWSQVRELMDPSKSEPCGSMILEVLSPLRSQDRRRKLTSDFLDFLLKYFKNPDIVNTYPQDLEKKLLKENFTASDIANQIMWKLSLIDSIQSFIMERIDIEDNIINPDKAVNLAKKTLAYHLSKEEDKARISKLFSMIAENINTIVGVSAKRKLYSKTLLGINATKEIAIWTEENFANLLSTNNIDELLKNMMPLICKFLKNKSPLIFSKDENLLECIQLWLHGNSFANIYSKILELNIRTKFGTKSTASTIEDIIKFCESFLSYDVSFILAAVTNFVESYDNSSKIPLLKNLKLLQKMFKYGLFTKEEISIYEIGFCDRIISNRIYRIVGAYDGGHNKLKSLIKNKYEDIKKIIEDMPSYFSCLLDKFK